jgi:uncharacterized membrane protein
MSRPRIVVRIGMAGLLAAGLSAAAAVLPVVRAAAAVAPPMQSFSSASCVSAKDCIAVGQAGIGPLPLVGRWNGAKWTTMKVSLPAGGKSGSLSGVSCASASVCIAVGEYVGSGTSPGGRALAESWNGKKWTPSALPVPKGSQGMSPAGISCLSAKSCVAVGAYQAAGNRIVPLAEVWNGNRWAVTSPGGQGGLSEVSCPSRGHCIAVGAPALAGPAGRVVEWREMERRQGSAAG